MAPCEGSGSNRAVQFQDSPFGVVLIQDHLVLGTPDEQAIETNTVDLAGDCLLVGEITQRGPGRIRMDNHRRRINQSSPKSAVLDQTIGPLTAYERP